MGPRDVSTPVCPIFRSDEQAKYEHDISNAPLTKAEQVARERAEKGTLELSALMAEFDGQFHDAAIVDLKKRVKISYKNEKPRGSFDLSCGCKLYYPNSTGANS